MASIEFEGFDAKTTKALKKKVALPEYGARGLIAATIDFLTMAIEDHPEGVTDMEIVDFAIDQLETVPSVTEDAWIYAGTEAFRATALGLLQTLTALER
jgi:hypothetical protein